MRGVAALGIILATSALGAQAASSSNVSPATSVPGKTDVTTDVPDATREPFTNNCTELASALVPVKGGVFLLVMLSAAPESSPGIKAGAPGVAIWVSITTPVRAFEALPVNEPITSFAVML